MPLLFRVTDKNIFACSCRYRRLQAGFQALEVRTANFSAILDVLTPNTYIMVVLANPHIELAAVRLNILQAKDHFEKLPALSIGR